MDALPRTEAHELSVQQIVNHLLDRWRSDDTVDWHPVYAAVKHLTKDEDYEPVISRLLHDATQARDVWTRYLSHQLRS